MKFLIVASALLAVALAQGQQRPRQNYNYNQQQQQPQQNNNYNNQQQNNYQQQQNDDYNDNQQQQPQQQQRQQQQQPPQQRQSHQPRQQEPVRSTTYIPIIRFDKEQGADGSYKAAWETGNNIIAEEQGYVKDLGPDPDSKDGAQLKAQVQEGSYSYTSPEGQLITVHYTADEFGFHPTGDHLPTPPPVSAEVQKGLDLIYAGIRKQQEQAARQQSNPQQNQYKQQRNQYEE